MEVDLRFSLQNICTLTGVSHQSIRTYEKMGVLPKIAEEGNGYRYYHFPDLQRVVFLRYYAGMGVPIKAAAQLINGAGPKRMEEVLDRCETDIRYRIRFDQAVLECLEEQRSLLGKLEPYEERCEVSTRPALYRLRCFRDGKIVSDPEAVRLMKEWASLFPVTRLSGVSQGEAMDRPDQIVDPGYAIRAEHADLLSTTDSPYIDYYPSVSCVQSILRISSTAKDFFSMGAHVQRYLKENGYHPQGELVSISIANKTLVAPYEDDPSDFVCCWVPIS